jgi:hypothetical protein
LFTHLDVALDVEPQHSHGRSDLICKAWAGEYSKRGKKSCSSALHGILALTDV